jgi:hypothetical protein
MLHSHAVEMIDVSIALMERCSTLEVVQEMGAVEEDSLYLVIHQDLVMRVAIQILDMAIG